MMKSILDFFLPRLCSSCNEPLNKNSEIICGSCLLQIEQASEEFIEFEYQKKFKENKLISGFATPFLFEKDMPLQKLIHELKYNKKFPIGIFLGRYIAENLEREIIEWEPNFILPVPLHKLKKAERGFNQSYYIAKGISSVFKLPIKTNLIKRVKYTITQTNLSKKEREENIQNAFEIRKRKTLHGKTVLIIDDVITTGATISECAKILRKNGAENVYAISVGIAG